MTDTCPKCHAPMQPGIALAQTYTTGLPDFPGDDPASAVQTISPGGPGRIVQCLKCTECGHSVSAGEKEGSSEPSRDLLNINVSVPGWLISLLVVGVGALGLLRQAWPQISAFLSQALQ